MRSFLPVVVALFLSTCSEPTSPPKAPEPGPPKVPTIQFPSGPLISDTIGATRVVPTAVAIFDTLGQPYKNASIVAEIRSLIQRPVAVFLDSQGRETTTLTASSPTGQFGFTIRFAADTGTAVITVRMGQAITDSFQVRATAGHPIRFAAAYGYAGDNAARDTVLQIGRTADIVVVGFDRKGNKTFPPKVNFIAEDSSAAVTIAGVVTAKSFGESTIRITSAMGSDSVRLVAVPVADVIATRGKVVAFYFGTLDGHVKVPLTSAMGNAVWLNQKELVLPDLSVADTTGQVTRNLVASGFHAAGPLPTADAVYFSHRLINGKHELWRVGKSGGNEQRILELPDSMLSPSISRDGSLIIFSNTAQDVFVLDTRTQAVRNLGLKATKLAISPDGKTFIFNDGRCFPATLSMSAIDSVKVAHLGQVSCGVNRLQWSPDGTYVLADFSPFSSGAGPYIRHVASGRVVNGTRSIWNIAWRP